MAVRKPVKKGTHSSAKGTTVTAKASKGVGFSDEEKAAMRQRVKEVQGTRRRGSGGGRADEESEVLEKIAAMQPADRAMAERLHALIKAGVPGLTPRLWYGMPAYAKDGKLVCHFQDAKKFGTRYATLGFSDNAHLDEGNMWPNAFALMKVTPAEEARIIALIKRAMG